MKKLLLSSSSILATLLLFFMSLSVTNLSAQSTATIGTGTSSNYFYGPIYRSSAGSSFDYSRYHHIYTAAELGAAGVSPGSSLSEVAWFMNTASGMAGTGDATLKIYVKNSSATVATNDTWANLISGSSLVFDGIYNTTNDFPLATGWLPFTFTAPVVYTGGSIEVSIDWDCSAITGNPTTGAFNWLYETLGSNLSTYANNSSLPLSTTTTSPNRPNTQFEYTPGACPGPTGLAGTNFLATSADISWNAVGSAVTYDWLVVPAGAGSSATPITSGNTAMTMVTPMGLMPVTSYDFYVRSDCGGAGVGLYSGPYNFLTGCINTLSGIYSIGGATPDYVDFTAAVTALNTCGITGPVTFNVAAGTYTESVDLGSIVGSSATNTVTFDGGSAATTTLTSAGGGNNATISLDATEYITFQNMTIENTKTAADAWGVFLTNGTNEVTIDNCDITLATSTSSDRSCIQSGGSATSAFTDGNSADNLTVSNCNMIGAYYGIYLNGEAATVGFDNGNVITDNTIDAYLYGVYLDNQIDITITNNTILTTGTSTGMDGIYCFDLVDFTITGNTINVPDYGLYITDANFDAPPTGRSLIANNMVQSDADYGIYILDAIDVDVFFNSCLADRPMAVNGTPSAGLDVRNNIFVSNNNDFAFTDFNATPGAYTTFDNNIFETGGTNLFDFGPTFVDLAAFQAANPAFNANSFQGDPLYASATDLHLLGTLADGVAAPIASITVDIDGDTRTATPDIGADEYSPAVCFPPTALNSNLLSFTSVDLFWTTGGAANWLLEFGPAGFTPGTGVGVAVSTLTTDSFNIIGLTPSTSYDWYVRDYCGGTDTSIWSSTGSFYTGYCLPSSTTATTFIDNFSTTNAITNISHASGYTTGGFEDNFNTDSVVVSASTNFDFTLTLQGGTVGAAVWVDWDQNLIFDASERVFNTTGYGSGPFSGTITVSPTQAIGNYYMRTMVHYNASNPADPCASNTRLEVEDYRLTVAPLPPCVAPTLLSDANVGETSIDLLWATGGSTDWVVEYGAPGFVQGTGTMVSVTGTDSLNLTGLMAATNYDWFVADYCGGTDTSAWTGPNSFVTNCPASIVAPYMQNFDAVAPGTNPPVCWTNTLGGEPWLFRPSTGGTGSSPGYAVTGSVDHTTGSGNYAWIDASGTNLSGIGANELITPMIDVSALTTPLIGFWILSNNTNDIAQNSIELSYWDGVAWVLLTTYSGNNANWVEVSAALPAGAPSVTQFKLEQINAVATTPASSQYHNDLLVDDFFVVEAPPCPGTPNMLSSNIISFSEVDLDWNTAGSTDWVVEFGPTGFAQGTGIMASVSTFDSLKIIGLMPNTAYDWYVADYCGGTDTSSWAGPSMFTTPVTCPAPTGLNANVISFTEADLFWTTGGASNWFLEFGAPGFAPGTGAGTSVALLSSDSFNIIGLMPNTNYDFYVRDYCGPMDTSLWSSVGQFFTGYCTPGGGITDPNGITNVTIGSINNTTAIEAGSYGDYTTMVANAGQGVSLDISVELSTGYTYNVFAWIDWNNDLDFDDAGEEFYLGEAAGAIPSLVNGSIPVPASASLGNHLIRIGAADNGLGSTTPSNPCYTGAYAAFEDYTLNIITCNVPVTMVPASFCNGDSLVLSDGTAVTTAGMFNDTLSAITGCDSVLTYNVTVLMPTTSTNAITICQGTPLMLAGGTMVTTSGTYTEVYTNAVGCDSTATYNVTMNVATSSSTDIHLCDGATFTLPLSGTVVSSANAYIETSTNSVGCDSVITYNVTTGMSSTQALNVSFCTGGSVMLADGSSASAAGTMMVTVTNASGCDDVITYTVTENTVGMGTINAAICMGDTYMFDGNMLTAAGTYTMMSANANGCDSTTTLNLSVNSGSSSSVNASICMGDNYMFDGNMLTTAGMYTMVTPGANGCDSTVTLTLAVNATSSSSISATICNGDNYMFDGNMLTAAGTYTATGTNAAGCDSVTTLTLAVDMAMNETRAESICNGDNIEFGTQVLTAEGVYTETFTNANGCSYDVTLTLTVNNSTSTTEEVLLCGGVTEYTLANGTVVTEAGVYTAITPASNGCDNIITYNVSTCVGIFDVENNIGMTAYPNPSTDVLNIEFSEKLSNNNSVMILNVLGQAVYSVENTSDLKLVVNTSEFTSGVYYINVTSDNKTSVKSFTVAK